jgi:hypothetical protein
MWELSMLLYQAEETGSINHSELKILEENSSSHSQYDLVFLSYLAHCISQLHALYSYSVEWERDYKL